MFRIGEFAKLSRVSVKILRHYDEIGLLKPAHTDPETGYRYYLAEQITRLNRIMALKDFGFKLEQIALVLDGELSAHQIRALLDLKRAEVEQRIEHEQSRLTRIESRLKAIEHEGDVLPTHEVVCQRVEPQLIASVRYILDDPAEIDRAIERAFDVVEMHAYRYRARAASPPITIYHKPNAAQQIELEIAVPLTEPIPHSQSVKIYELPGAETMACLVHAGSYEMLDQAAGVLRSWIDGNAYRIVGPSRELYLRFGANTDHYSLPPVFLASQGDIRVTELQIPVEKI